MDLRSPSPETESYYNNDESNDCIISSKLSIKPHNFKLGVKLEEVMQDLEESKRSIQSLKNDLLRISHINNEQDNETSRFFLDEILRVAKDLKNMSNIHQEETSFLKKQMGLLNQDRIKLTQNLLILDNRVVENEKDIGFKNVYDL